MIRISEYRRFKELERSNLVQHVRKYVRYHHSLPLAVRDSVTSFQLQLDDGQRITVKIFGYAPLEKYDYVLVPEFGVVTMLDDYCLVVDKTQLCNKLDEALLKVIEPQFTLERKEA